MHASICLSLCTAFVYVCIYTCMLSYVMHFQYPETFFEVIIRGSKLIQDYIS